MEPLTHNLPGNSSLISLKPNWHKCNWRLDEPQVGRESGAMGPNSFSVAWRPFTTCALLVLGIPAVAAAGDALAEYVGQADSSFIWKKTAERQVGSSKAIRLELTSQTWRGHEWHHEMLVVRPERIRNSDIALLFITGDGQVDDEFDLLNMLATRAGAVAAIINRVPNQPLYYGRKEDALIAYTFDQYTQTGDKTWPLLFPMVKSAVRGMDTIQAVAKESFDQKVGRFLVTGASKRGWTTWLSAAVDPRVKAIAPIVIDMLNMKVQTQWAKQMYGQQSEEIKDYTDFRITERMDEPRMVELRQWIDPYSYRARYTLPKLLLLGTNDPYWVVDSLRNYWGDLQEPKLVFQTPNAGHDLGGGEQAKQTLAAYFQMVADGQRLPKMTWKFKQNRPDTVSLEVNLRQPASVFRLWTADSSDRDFRDDKWSSTELRADSTRHVVAQVQKPHNGFRAYLVEAELKTKSGETYKLSTEARVIPDGPPVAGRKAIEMRGKDRAASQAARSSQGFTATGGADWAAN
jgi:PhoPQ-activated pathogenicity-related protein